MDKVRICYIDDQTQAERYRKRLSRAEDLECRLITPPLWEEIANFEKEPPDLFLIDYELSQRLPDGSVRDYRGSTLSAELRSRLPDCPIVLITRKSILRELDPRTRRQLTQHMPGCDEIILKSMLDEHLEETQFLLLSIARGFRHLHEIKEKTWNSLVRALEATEEEAAILREASPPLQEGQWIVTEAARWIRNVILRFPGILYDPIHAATRLGISVESFLNEKVQELVEPARYTGVFAPLEGRWWKERLFVVAQRLITEMGIDAPLNQAFAEAFSRKYGIDLSPAVCIWDHTPIADWVCYLLRQPVKIKNSLRYYPDSRPSIMEHARVSFRAIRESSEFDEALLDAEGAKLLTQIEALPDPIQEATSER